MAVAGELQRDWAREDTAGKFADILAAHGGGSGIAYAWEQQSKALHGAQKSHQANRRSS